LAEVVCSYLNSDKNIAEKLIWCCKNVNVDVLKRVQQSAGKTGVSALKRAMRINDSGVYVISKDGIKMELVNEKHMQSNELKDLESILMLRQSAQVLGDELDEERGVLEYFIKVFSGVMRLSELFGLVVSSGCGFFDDCEISVFCCKDRPINYLVKLSGGFRIEGTCCKFSLKKLRFYYFLRHKNLELFFNSQPRRFFESIFRSMH